MRPSIILTLPAMMVFLACGDDTGSGATETEGGEAGSSEAGSTTSSTTGSTSSSSTSGAEGGETSGSSSGETSGSSSGEEETGSGTTTGGEPTTPDPARGVTIVKVTANSGVEIPIAMDDAEIEVDARGAKLAQKRATMIRAHVEVAPDWVPREIQGVLTLTLEGGTTRTLKKTMMLSRSSAEWEAEQDSWFPQLIEFEGFFFGIEAEDALPGARYRIELFEVGTPPAELPEPETPPAFPVDGDADVGFEDSFLNLHLVMVPIHYSYGDCDAMPDISDPVIQVFDDDMFQKNPVDTLDLVVREVYERTDPLESADDLSELVDEMSQLRAADGAEDNVYYYGFFNNCGKCLVSGTSGCVAGQANLPGDGRDDAWGRAGAGVDSAKTLTHEVGHMQGRRHVACQGTGAAGPDPTYPYDEGIISNWGFGIRDFALHHPTRNFDYMSYCGPGWMSDWQWNATWERIETLSAWDLEPAPVDPDRGRILVGSFGEDGRQRWWTQPGDLGADRDSGRVVDLFDGAGGVVASEPAHVIERAHGSGYVLAVPLPHDIDPLTLGFRDRASGSATRWLSAPTVRHVAQR